MLVNLKIPDETYEVYARRNPENPRLELERALQAFSALDPRRVALFLNQEELGELSGILGLPVSDVKTLLELLKRSQLASFGEGLEVKLNAGQRLRLKQMADFYNQPFKAYAESEVLRGVVAAVGP